MITHEPITEDIEDIELVSSCCFEMVAHVGSTMICTSCEEPCRSVYPPCPMDICDGSGLVADYHLDTDTHIMMPDGEKSCLHVTF